MCWGTEICVGALKETRKKQERKKQTPVELKGRALHWPNYSLQVQCLDVKVCSSPLTSF